MKIKKIIQIIILSLLLYSCGTSIKDALQGKKRSENSDEFLVKKKNPLILPPNYGELPVPSSVDKKQEIIKQEDSKDVKKILEIDTDGNQIDKKKCTTDNTDKCLENSLLEKIKNL
jgi:hypothetical protein